jgi:endonuclease/exonuclease/phosphatase family metal-dependent hydrolase
MGSTLTVVTYNIQHGRGMDGHFDLKRTAYVLMVLNADVILLQEVDCWCPGTGMTCQPAVLAKMLNMDYAYGAVKHYRPGSYGNAILSRYFIASKKNHILVNEDDQRCCLEAAIRTPKMNFTVFNLHLGLKSAERYRHLKDIILPRVQAVSGPAMLGGDFNARPESAEISLLQDYLQDSFLVNSGEYQYTFPSDQPRHRIDFIFLNNQWQITEYKIIPHTLASDHLPVVAKIQV